MRRLFYVAVVLSLLSVAVFPARAQTLTPPVQVASLINSMSPEERVGQLFLVTFNGTDTSEASQIYNLIVNYHVGGVVLRAANDNFSAAPNTTVDAYALISALQEIERTSAGTEFLTLPANQPKERVYVPLFVGIAQEGNGAPTDQILSGLTPLPSEMAIGATWQTDLAEQVGAVAGRELSALGFNLFFGPSLDVLEQPASVSGGDLGTRVFGGDPFWVGEMGRAYIRGLHDGSSNRLLVVAKHFPGRGGSNRSPEAEIPTVRKSLEQLKQIELAPFFSVTGNALDVSTRVDGLLVSHIRYQGFQNNIRATTRPVSFDPQALTEILKLPEFATWYANGGLIVSDDLGLRSVRDFYAPGGSNFNARIVARDAFLAGNDLMYLGNITSSDSADSYSTTRQVLDFFAQKYREDTAFAQRVDEALTRIITKKFLLYNQSFSSPIMPNAQGLASLNTSSALSFTVASEAATLLSPDAQELAAALPAPPSSSDYLVFLSNSSTAQQCSTCPAGTTFTVDAFQQSIVRLYGLGAGGQVNPTHLTSYSFTELNNLLNGTGADYLEPDLHRAQWVIISLTDSAAGQPALVSRFLSERQDLLRSKKVMLFAFGAPYLLDSTDISRLTAYFGLYSKTPAFIDVAARILFQEMPLNGFSPVSVPGIGYDLITVTSPNPDQVITLFLDLPAAPPSAALSTLTPEAATTFFSIGDLVTLHTGVILDHNGNPVPDGTVVRFAIKLGGDSGGLIQQLDTTTVAGIAQVPYRLEKPGLIEISAASEPANLSQVLQLNVTEGQPAVVTVIAPVVSETAEPVQSTPVVEYVNDFIRQDGVPRFGGWILFLFALVGGGALAYWTGERIMGSARWGMRWVLCTSVGGLIAYNYLALSLPGAASALIAGGGATLLGVTVLGEMLGAFGAWMWMRQR